MRFIRVCFMRHIVNSCPDLYGLVKAEGVINPSLLVSILKAALLLTHHYARFQPGNVYRGWRRDLPRASGRPWGYCFAFIIKQYTLGELH